VLLLKTKLGINGNTSCLLLQTRQEHTFVVVVLAGGGVV
jgi:hypothetical protein